VACVSLDIAITSIDDRLRGYSQAIRDHDMPVSKDLLIRIKKRDPGALDLHDSLKSLADSHHPPDGFLVTTDGLALRTLSVLESFKRKINEHFKIARFGSDSEGRSTGMICIEQPHVEIGIEAATLLKKRIESPSPAYAPRKIVLKPVLKV